MNNDNNNTKRFDFVQIDWENAEMQESPEGVYVLFTEYEEAQDRIKYLEMQNLELVNALREILREELNAQRPGGHYSKSAAISRNALVKHRIGV